MICNTLIIISNSCMVQDCKENIMNKEIEKIIGGNIKALREKKKLTQEQMAAKLQVNGCDITRSAVAKIEVGQRHLYPDEIIILKKILNVEYDDIFNV